VDQLSTDGSVLPLASIDFYAGVYILEIPPLPLWGEYQPMSFGGKKIKSGREKEGKCKRKS
jgi:hypothetical protein